MPSLEEILTLQRKKLLAKEAALVAEMERQFNQAIEEVQGDVIAAEALVEKRLAQGGDAFPAKISAAQQNVIVEQLGNIVADIAQDVVTDVLTAKKAVQIAATKDFIDAANATDVHAGIDPTAIERIGLSLASDTPVRRLFDSLPELAAQAARDALFTGVAKGANPRQVGRAIARGGEIAKHRAQTIARTEVMRAYRNAQIDRMRKAPEIEKWVWVSARDRRTCAFCWAMHGRVFSTERQMATHPNCRCSQGPLPAGANTTAIVGNGKALFDKLSAADQLHILGGAKYRAFKNGAIEIRDLIGNALHKDWGPIGYEKSLRAVLGNEAAMKYYKKNIALLPPPVVKPKPVPKPKPPPKPKPTPPPPPPPPPPVAARTPFRARPTKAEMVTAAGNKGWKAVKGALPTEAPDAYKRRVAETLGAELDKRALTNPKLASQMQAFKAEFPDYYNAPGLGQNVSSRLVQSWAGTSADSNALSLSVQEMAARKFNVPRAHLEPDIKRLTGEVVTKYDVLLDNFVDVQYRTTQDFFREHGVTEVVMYRGQNVKATVAQGTVAYAQSVTLQPLSSFAAQYDTTNGFAGSAYGEMVPAKVAMKIPADQIFGTPITGFGCYNEYEFVVIGGEALPAHVLMGSSGSLRGSLDSYKGLIP